jgi:GNAT superfamily N-acetyltransferase
MAIANLVHPGLPERHGVFAEKIALFAAGCFVLTDGRRIVGYALSHPWRLQRIPPLDTFLEGLPADADCLYVHDIALLGPARGHGRGPAVMRRLERLAARRGYPWLAMVSVYDTRPLWRRLGFEVRREPGIARQLRSYGAAARYMVKRLAEVGSAA